MSDLRIDDTTGDLIIEEGNLLLNEGIESVRQFLRARLRTFLGDWLLDRSVGVPYIEEIFVKNPNPTILDSIFKREILNTPGVVELLEFEMTLDSELRKLSLDFKARTLDGIIIFSENYQWLRKKFKHALSLRDLGYKVKTGTIVWNQHKQKLTNDIDETIPLLWAHNIQNNDLAIPFNETKKPQYIHYPIYDTGPSIIVNRITGASSKATLKAAIVPEGMKYLGENHLNIVYKDSDRNSNLLLPNEYSKLSLEDIHKVIISKETIEVMRNITGNTQISKTELELLLPIY